MICSLAIKSKPREVALSSLEVDAIRSYRLLVMALFLSLLKREE